jgi:inorganic pyrophosphatase
MIELPAFDRESGYLNAIIDTPKGSRNKFKYDPKTGMFKLGGPLPLGNVFPFDFGYIPSTEGDDGDALDILVLLDDPVFTGCLVRAKLIGALEAEQTEDSETTRNDRLIGVAAESRNHSHVRFIGNLNSNLVHEIERFFISYNETKGKRFKVIGRSGPDKAMRLVEVGMRNFRKTHQTSKRRNKSTTARRS